MTFDMAIPGTVLCVFVCRCVRSRYDLTIVAWMVGDEFVMLMAKGVGMVLDRLIDHTLLRNLHLLLINCE